MEIKLETGNNATDLGKILLYILIAGVVISAIFTFVVLFFFMAMTPNM